MNAFKSSDRILIVGGTGFIGRRLAERCLQYTNHVTCLSLTNRPDIKSSLKTIKLIQTDISKKNHLHSALQNKSFDYVFNLGGYIDHAPYLRGGRKLIESHFIGLMNLIDYLDKNSLKGFVQIGSSDEYGGAPAPQSEMIRESPISPYSLAKTAASHFIQMLSRTEEFPGVVLRLFLVYGPGQDDNRFLPQIIKECIKNAGFKTSEGAQLRDFCYIDDVIDAIEKAAVTPAAKGHVINIGSGIPAGVKDVVQKVISFTGGGRPKWGAYPYRKGENMELYADISLAKKLLQWGPITSLDEGLRMTIEYYKNITSEEHTTAEGK